MRQGKLLSSAAEIDDAFIMRIGTTQANEVFALSCRNVGVFDAEINWGDGNFSTVTAYNDTNLSHTYSVAGDYIVRITGIFPSISFNRSVSGDKVKEVLQLGDVGWQDFYDGFEGCDNLTSFKTGITDTSAVTTTAFMFDLCSSLETIDLTGFDASNITSFDYMFRSCTSLTSLDLSGFNTSSLQSLRNTFNGCSALTSLDVSNFDTSKVTRMESMFNGCSSLTSLDVSSFDTSNVTNMGSMFGACTSLTSLDLSNFNTSNVEYMNSMFYGTTNLASVDLSSFDTSKVTNMGAMFSQAVGDYINHALLSLDLSSFDTSSVTNFGQMFYRCANIQTITIDNTKFLTSSVTGGGFSQMFNQCFDLTAIDVSNFDTSGATSITWMFGNCSSLTSLDLSHFNTSNVTEAYQTFIGCSSLTSLNISNWDVSNLVNMENIFGNCSSLTTLDVSSWNTASATNMTSVFHGCSSLTSVDVSGWNTSNVTTMNNMFNTCSSLTSVGDLSNWNTSNVTNMQRTFFACPVLENLVLNTWDVSSLTGINAGERFLEGSNLALTTAEYDATLAAWAAQTLQSGIQFWFGDAQYTIGSAAETARNTLTNTYSWSIFDGGGISVDVTPDAVDWPNFNVTGTTQYDTSTQTITSISAPISLQVSFSDLRDPYQMSVLQNGTVTQGPSSAPGSFQFNVTNNDTIAFRFDVSNGNRAEFVVTIINQSDGNATLDTFTGEVDND